MGQENNFWHRLACKYRGFDGVLQRIESSDTAAGIPDVYYVSQGVAGWVELKARRTFPARAGTVVRLDTYTELQRRWLAAAWSCGGNVMVAVDIDGESYWFEGADAVVVGTRWNKEEFLQHAYGIGDRTLLRFIKKEARRSGRAK